MTQRAGAAPASRLHKVQTAVTARGQWNRGSPTQKMSLLLLDMKGVNLFNCFFFYFTTMALDVQQ